MIRHCMIRRFIRAAIRVLLPVLLTACVTAAPDATGPAGLPRAPPGDNPLDAIGRSGPDGAPLEADRGIGGTGAPLSTTQTADRGIGGTGIVGVITGFGSVFVNGIEIRYDTKTPIDIDGTTASTAALRAGQLVAIQAEGSPAAPQAITISLRSAVAGRVEASLPGTLTIAGQAVSVPPGTWGAARFVPGDWVRVSGLPAPNGTIIASRLDPAPRGILLIRGRITRDREGVRIGKFVLPGGVPASLKHGQFVVVSGDYTGGSAHLTAVAPDPVFATASDAHLSVQAFVQVDQNVISINGMRLGIDPAVARDRLHDGIAVVSLERGTDGSYTAVGLRYTDFKGHTDRSNGGGKSRVPRRDGPPDAGSNGPPTGRKQLAKGSGHIALDPLSGTSPANSADVQTANSADAQTALRPTPARASAHDMAPSPSGRAVEAAPGGPTQIIPPPIAPGRANSDPSPIEPAQTAAPPARMAPTSENSSPPNTVPSGQPLVTAPPQVVKLTSPAVPRRVPAVAARHPHNPAKPTSIPPGGLMTGAVSATPGDAPPAAAVPVPPSPPAGTPNAPPPH